MSGGVIRAHSPSHSAKPHVWDFVKHPWSRFQAVICFQQQYQEPLQILHRLRAMMCYLSVGVHINKGFPFSSPKNAVWRQP